MKTKRITALLCALAVAVSVSVGASAATSTNWPQFLGSAGITAAQTPASPAETQLEWSASSVYNGSWGPTNGFGSPIYVNDAVYVTDKAAGKLIKRNAKTGAVLAQVSVSNLPAFFCYIAYGDGKIFVPQETAGGVKIAAFSADTLSSVWQSPEITITGGTLQTASPVLYENGHIYFGAYLMDMNTYQYTSGAYVSIDTGTGAVTWQKNNASAGYYWNGGTVLGSAVAVSDTAGTIHTFDLLTGAEKDSISVGGSVNTTPAYSGGTLYVAVKNGTIFAVKASTDGILDDSTVLHSTKLGSKITSSPVVYNGRLYVAGGGDSASPFSVLNASDLNVIYQISGIHSQSTPLLSTAYATADNHQQVLLYVADYGTSDENYEPQAGSSRVYVIKDSAVQTSASYETLFTPTNAQFCSQSLIPSKDGMLYYYNDSGTLFALGKKAAQQNEGTSSISSSSAGSVSSNSSSQSSSTVSSSSVSSSSSAASSASALDSPKTGEAPIASAAVMIALSGAALLFLKKKSKS